MPDLKSRKKDVVAAEIPFTKPSKDDNRHRRTGLHLLRHTLTPLLGSTVASDTVKKAIMRPADEGVPTATRTRSCLSCRPHLRACLRR